MAWWKEESISLETAKAFIQECRDFTIESMKRYTPELKERDLNHILGNKRDPFSPIGAVVHSTKTKTAWDAIRTIAKGKHGTHFIVTSHEPPSSYKLLSDLPSAILAPMSSEHAVPGNNYMSRFTWSIDIRNTGKLRPYVHPLKEGIPSPIYFNEESKDFFKLTSKGKPRFYWWENLWRDEFVGNVFQWYNYFYETPTSVQLESLIALLRVLNALDPYGLDPRFVVPSNCITGGDPTFPQFEWHNIRANIKSQNPVYTLMVKNHPSSSKINDWAKTQYEEDQIIFKSSMHKWRTTPDDDDMKFLISGQEIKWKRGTTTKAMDSLVSIGYSEADLNTAARMFLIANRIKKENLNDIQADFIDMKIDKIKGF
jgi:hypothetical protein